MVADNSRMLGYVRVSTGHQNTDRQREALLKEGVAPRDIFTDTQSGNTEDNNMNDIITVDDLVNCSDFFDLRNYTLCFTPDNEPVYVPISAGEKSGESIPYRDRKKQCLSGGKAI